MADKPVKKKLNRADYMFVDKTGEELIKRPGDVNGLDFQIRNLTDCQVGLYDTTTQVSFEVWALRDSCLDLGGQLQGHNVRRGPREGVDLLPGLRRLHDPRGLPAVPLPGPGQVSVTPLCSSCTVFLYVPNDPIIESSSNLRFAPFNVAYPLLD